MPEGTVTRVERFSTVEATIVEIRSMKRWVVHLQDSFGVRTDWSWPGEPKDEELRSAVRRHINASACVTRRN